MIPNSKYLAFMFGRITLSVVPMVVLWWFWTWIVRFGDTKAESKLVSFVFVAMMLAVVVRKYVLPSTRYPCIVYMNVIAFCVAPLAVLWWFWLAIIRFASPHDMYVFLVPTALVALVLAVIIRGYLLQSTKYTLVCLVFTEIIMLVWYFLIDGKWLITLSWTDFFEVMFKEMLFHWHTWNLVIGFLIGVFLGKFSCKWLSNYKKNKDSSE